MNGSFSRYDEETPGSIPGTPTSSHTPDLNSQEDSRLLLFPQAGTDNSATGINVASVDGPHIESLDEISRCLREAGFDYIPAYSVLRDEQDYGGADGLRRVARAIREVHGGIYRTAAKLWTEQRGVWELFPADPIPRRVVRVRDGEVRCYPR